jgi:hypothetical protein
MFDILQSILLKLKSRDQLKIVRLNKQFSGLKIIDPAMQHKKQIWRLNKENKIWQICQNPKKYWYTLPPAVLSASRFVTLKLILENPTYPWKWEILSRNLFIPVTQILAHPNLPWGGYDLSYREDITPEIVAANLNTKLKVFTMNMPLICDKNIADQIDGYWYSIENATWEYVVKFDIVNRYSGDYITLNCITWEKILENPSWKWNLRLLYKKPDVPLKYLLALLINPDATLPEILKTELKLEDMKNLEKFYKLSGCSQVPIDFIIENQNLNWHWHEYFMRPDVNEENIMLISKDKWTVDIAANSNISYEFFIKNNYRWKWSTVYKHRKINWDLVDPNDIEKQAPAYILKKYFHDIDLTKVVKNPNLDEELIDMILERRQTISSKKLREEGELSDDIIAQKIKQCKKIDMGALCKHPVMTWRLVEKFKSEKWNWLNLLNNPSIDPDIIAEHYLLFFSFVTK